jgi:hypothetical protein
MVLLRPHPEVIMFNALEEEFDVALCVKEKMLMFKEKLLNM